MPLSSKTESGLLVMSIDGDGNLAGSRLSMSQAAKNFWKFTNCSLPELFRMAALNTARLLRMDHLLGSIELRKRANLVMLDAQFNVIKTFFQGKIVYSAGPAPRGAEPKAVAEDQPNDRQSLHNFGDRVSS